MSLIKKLFGHSDAVLLPILKSGAIILDVRTPAEFANGHAEGAVLIPVQELEQRVHEVKEMNKPVLAYCRSGVRSGKAAKMLKAKGIEAYNVGSKGDMEKLLGQGCV